jgi:hypothetical protein
MTILVEKCNLIILDYYNEYSSKTNILYFERIRYLGIDEDKCLRFQIENGRQIKRSIHDAGVKYEHAAASDGYMNIVFNEIICDTNINHPIKIFA